MEKGKIFVAINGNLIISCVQFPPQANMRPTAWHIAQPYYRDGIQECSVIVFGGNGYVKKTLPGSPRIAVNDLKILEFGKFKVMALSEYFNCYVDPYNIFSIIYHFVLLIGIPSLKRLCLAIIRLIVSRYDLCQLDHQRKRQIEEYCHQTACKNTFFRMSSILLI